MKNIINIIWKFAINIITSHAIYQQLFPINNISMVKLMKCSIYALLTSLTISNTACSNEDREPNPPGTSEVTIPEDAVNLSEKETANCYIAFPGSVVTFSTRFKGNSTTLETGNVTGIKLLWTDTKGLVTNLKLATGSKQAIVWLDQHEGNALVAATDDSGNILWSWHLWVTDYNPQNNIFTTPANANGTQWSFMDRNLGALSATPADGYKTHGLLYQWGRKDPFPAPANYTELDDNYNYISGKNGEVALYDIEGNKLASIGSSTQYHGTIDLSVANPMTYFAMTYIHTGEMDEYGEEIVLNDPLTGDWTTPSNDDLWGGVSFKKSVYDPCPPGWKVPVCDANGATPYDWLSYTSMTWDNTNHGAIQNGQWFPATGTRVYVSGGCDFTEANPYSGLWIGTAGKAHANLELYPTLYGQYMFIINGKRTFKVNKDRRSQGMSLRAVADI